jgi:hypothetical protein
LRKLDFLLEKFLLFAAKEAEYRGYLRSILSDVRGTLIPPAPELLSPPVYPDRRQGKQRGRQFQDRQMIPDNRESSGAGDPAMTDDAVIAEIEGSYQREIAKVKAQAEKEQDENTKAVLDTRLDILQRRSEFVGKVEKILTNLSNQLKLLEDTFGLINDEIRARSPEQILMDIEDVVTQANTMTDVLEELAPYEQMVARLGA